MIDDPKIVIALDYASPQVALNFVQQLDPKLCRLKIGKELFTAAGPQLIETLISKGFGIFLDLKFHDIPTTVGKACEAASRLGVWMLNVHASGGSGMMEAAMPRASTDLPVPDRPPIATSIGFRGESSRCARAK